MAEKWIDLGYPVRTVLRLAGVSPATYYWRRTHSLKGPARRGGRPLPGYVWTPHGTVVSDEGVKGLLRSAIAGEAYPYGYHKLTHWLRREHGLIINKKRVYRLCKEIGILLPRRRRKRRRVRRVSCNREVVAVNQLWETDLKYGYIAGERRFFFVQAILDVADRMVVDYHIGLTCTGPEAAQTLRGAVERRKETMKDRLPVVRTDNGAQFTSKAWTDLCDTLGIEHECIPPRTPNKNAHIEAFHAILEEECLGRHEFRTFAEAYTTVVAYIEYYNECRLHGSLGYRPPAEYHKAITRNHEKPTPIKL